jgi:hypothetical protein
MLINKMKKQSACRFVVNNWRAQLNMIENMESVTEGKASLGGGWKPNHVITVVVTFFYLFGSPTVKKSERSQEIRNKIQF